MGVKTTDHHPITGLHPTTSIDAASNNPSSEERSEWATRLRKYCDTFQQRWCASTCTYRKWNECQYTKPPSQWLAFQQLQFRHTNHYPILVNIPAQAGFGKSELINAWRLAMKIQNENWECVAPSGVAAVQINGKTLHGLIRMDGKCSSFLSPESSQARELKTVHGIIIDEVGMISDPVFKEFVKCLQQFPLREDYRLRIPADRRIPMFGFRDVILSGDLRQLPPADGKIPLFATKDYHTLFEFFILSEDRRHEREPAMQELKELIAWGGNLNLPFTFHYMYYSILFKIIFYLKTSTSIQK